MYHIEGYHYHIEKSDFIHWQSYVPYALVFYSCIYVKICFIPRSLFKTITGLTKILPSNANIHLNTNT